MRVGDNPVHCLHLGRVTIGKSLTNQFFPEAASIDGSTPAVSNHEVHNVDAKKHSLDEQVDVEKRAAFSDNETPKQGDGPRDPNIVDWDGPDDPENPLNWTAKRKVTATVSIALITFLT